MLRFFVVLVFGVAGAAGGQERFYSCTDENGKIAYTSDPSKYAGCALQNTYEKSPSQAAQPARKGSPAPAAAPALPAQRPVVSAELQRERDKKREEILRYELERETELYVRARDALLLETEKTPQEQDAEYVSMLTESRRIRAQNIIAIRQELARL